AWVALPEEFEETAPSFVHIEASGLPDLAEGDVDGRLIAGEAFGARAEVPVHSPLFYIHWTLPVGARLALPTDYPERAVYVASGAIEAGSTRLGPGQMAGFRPGAAPVLEALAPTVLLALGGEPIGPRFIDWNFVSSRKE